MLLRLPFDLEFEDLYKNDGLEKIHRIFLRSLRDTCPTAHDALIAAYDNPDAINAKDFSNIIIEAAPYLEDFITYLFGIENRGKTLKKMNVQFLNLLHIKRQFVQRHAIKTYPHPDHDLSQDILDHITAHISKAKDFEMAFADQVVKLQSIDDPGDDTKNQLKLLAQYAAWGTLTPNGQRHHGDGVLFQRPGKIDPENLLKNIQTNDNTIRIDPEHMRARDGFLLTDPGFSTLQAQDQAHYCIYCHKQGKDSCSTGLKPKKAVGAEASLNTPNFAKNDHGVPLNGCPLEEKVSEMNMVKAQGYDIGALAIITIDNPLVAATGHRICNDCMKSCIYQKQDPVNIPAVETNVLQNVLDLPFGFEIYGLLTRWNPFDIRMPLPHPPTGKNVLIAGMGPAGFTLSHYMLRSGHNVVGIDGLKIEPLPHRLIHDFLPIMGIQNVLDDLETRVIDGFGGVAEYGITVRWNKNYLKIIRLLLERQHRFSIHGGIRMGGTLTLSQCVEFGFHHISLCIGAGQPKLLDIPGGNAKGVRAASDFLMSLHQGGAFKHDGSTSLQIRLPLIVVGGGLTAIDTATESMAYYVRQCEKFKNRYDTLLKTHTPAEITSKFWDEDKIITKEMLDHAALFEEERIHARAQKRLPNFAHIIHKLGGVQILYRKPIQNAPSYKLNHEEVQKALEEGVHIIQNGEFESIEKDAFGAVCGAKIRINGETKSIDVKTILIAAGTKPNTNVYDDIPHELNMHLGDDGTPISFQAIDKHGNILSPEKCPKTDDIHVLTTMIDDVEVSFLGDLHPSFSGNVVKAMASAKRASPIINSWIHERQKNEVQNGTKSEHFENEAENIHTLMRTALTTTVHSVQKLSSVATLLTFHSPQSAKNFKIGQFFRLQNFHKHGEYLMEGLALSGLNVDKKSGLISTIVLNLGASSYIAQNLKIGERVVLMGPTGAPAEIPENENILLICGGYYNPVMAEIGRAMKTRNNNVSYIAAYKKFEDCTDLNTITSSCDHLILATDAPHDHPLMRPNDTTFHGNGIDALIHYAKKQTQTPLKSIDRIVILGAPFMLKAFQNIYNETLNQYFKPNIPIIGNVSAPMQCMMKGICSQCVCYITDETGQKRRIFACAHQDQNLQFLDFDTIFGRLTQQSTQEKLNALWIQNNQK